MFCEVRGCRQFHLHLEKDAGCVSGCLLVASPLLPVLTMLCAVQSYFIFSIGNITPIFQETYKVCCDAPDRLGTASWCVHEQMSALIGQQCYSVMSMTQILLLLLQDCYKQYKTCDKGLINAENYIQVGVSTSFAYLL